MIKKQGDIKMAKSTAMKAAEKAVAKSQNSKERPVVFGPDFAQFRINKDACISQGEHKYLTCAKSIPGGYLKMFVFGAGPEDVGKTVSGILELRRNLVGDNDFYYLRAQLAKGEKADKKLAFNETVSGAYEAADCQMSCGQKNLDFVIGFASV